MHAIGPFWNTIASLVFLLAGATGIGAILWALGRNAGPGTAAAIRVHRAAGWMFSLLFYALFMYMLVRVGNYWEEFPPRITAHITLAVTMFLLIPIKVLIARFLPNFRGHLFLVGLLTYAMAFPMVLLTAGHYLLSVRILEPYVYHADFSRVLADDRLGKEFLISRCSSCHLLERVLKPRSRQAWGEVMARMVQLSPRISPGEASQILFFLTKNFLPRETPSTAESLIEKHCLPCHEPKEIYTKTYSRAGWRSVVVKMSGIDRSIVPDTMIEELVDELNSISKHHQ